MARRRMGLQHIEAFRAVIQTGSMTEAARRMHTSQPQISRLVAQLEQIAQFALFDRSGSRVFPTAEGTRFFQEVEKAFTGLTTLEAAAQGIRSFRADRLRVTAMPRLASGLLTRIAANFMMDYPEAMVSIRSGTATTVHEWVSSGLCDVGLAMLYQETSGVEVEPLFTGQCVAVLPTGHPLAARDVLTPTDLAEQPFIASPSGGQLAERIDQVFNAANARRRIVAETDLGASVCTLVGAGLGVSVINPLAAHEERENAGLLIRPFQPAIATTVALIYPPYVARSRLVSVFSDYARRRVQQELTLMA
ncbi:DNA-binding transcriptional LysR family regulator [Azorhizobium sp. AG788]|nr:DNA-binding transcriptional LysR family regulator [Azorhizobium sp. AG788]